MVNTFLGAEEQTRQSIAIYLAAINWLKEHECKHYFGAPLEVWLKFIPSTGPDTFVPVTNIVCRAAHLTDTVRFNRVLEEAVTIVVPLNNFAGLYVCYVLAVT